MFKFLFKKESKVELLIEEYMDCLNLSRQNFVKALNSCVEESHCEKFDFLITQTHKYESKADDIRQEINDLILKISSKFR